MNCCAISVQLSGFALIIDTAEALGETLARDYLGSWRRWSSPWGPKSWWWRPASQCRGWGRRGGTGPPSEQSCCSGRSPKQSYRGQICHWSIHTSYFAIILSFLRCLGLLKNVKLLLLRFGDRAQMRQRARVGKMFSCASWKCTLSEPKLKRTVEEMFGEENDWHWQRERQKNWWIRLTYLTPIHPSN